MLFQNNYIKMEIRPTGIIITTKIKKGVTKERNEKKKN